MKGACDWAQAAGEMSRGGAAVALGSQDEDFGKLC